MNTPVFTNPLRMSILEVPEVINKECSGIKIFGKLIKSILFSTDIAIIRNAHADAVIAVYPFTPHPVITQAITSAADIPVFCGVGGGLTQGQRSVDVALHAEFQGSIGVVLNAPTPLDTISAVKAVVAVPVIITIVSELTDISARIEAGADILNVSGGNKTVEIVRNIRKTYKDFPIIATGGGTEESILKTIYAGANAITYTPPSNGELFKVKMDQYRKEEHDKLTQNLH